MSRFGSVIVVAIFLTAAISNEVRAYSAELVHPHLTRLAFQVYKMCVDGETDSGLPTDQAKLEKLVEDAVTANVYEDESHYFRRIFNWHFFNPKRNDKRKGWKVIYETLDRTFEGIVKDFNKISQSEGNGNAKRVEFVELLGRTLHFIEDVTVPAHVVPAYHSVNLPWAVHEWKWQWTIKDGVDEYWVRGKFPGDGDELLEKLKSQQGLCEELRNLSGLGVSAGSPSKPEHLIKLLKLTLSKTHELLAEKICDLHQKEPPIWHYFWIKGDDDQFFGEYRNFDENLFAIDGPTVIPIGSVPDKSGCLMRKAESFNKYDEFVERLHIEAIKADVRALFVLRPLLKRFQG